MRPPVASGTVYIKDRVDVWNKEPTIGNAELAARLGSPVSFDRRGTVFAYDDFEDAPLKWDQYLLGDLSGGTGQSSTLSNEHPSRGSGSMKVVPPNKVDDFEYATRYFYDGGKVNNRIGIEFNVNMYDTVNQRSQVIIDAYTGSRRIRMGIRMQQSGSGGLSYLNNTSGDSEWLDTRWTSFNTSFTLATKRPYQMKIVADLENEKYARCLFGGTEIDMSSYTPYATDDTSVQHMRVRTAVVNGTITNPETYFNNVLLTITEPA